MESILVLTYVEAGGSALAKTSREAVTAGLTLATRLGVPLSVGLIGVDPADGACATQALGQTGARLLAASGEAFAQARYASDAAACEALCRPSEHRDRAGLRALCASGCGRGVPVGRSDRYAHHRNRRDG